MRPGPAPVAHWLSQHGAAAGATAGRLTWQASALSPCGRKPGPGRRLVGSSCGRPRLPRWPARPRGCPVRPRHRSSVCPLLAGCSLAKTPCGVGAHTAAWAPRPSRVHLQQTAPSPNKVKGQGVGTPAYKRGGRSSAPDLSLLSPRCRSCSAVHEKALCASCAVFEG